MDKITEKEAIKLLKKYSKNNEDFKKVLGHSEVVKNKAVDIGKKVKNIDLDFIKSASLLHDIGRFQCGPDKVKHGIVGAGILREEGLDKHALVAERHLGAGISKEEVIEQGLELPLNDYIPVSKEEKIIAHADNLVFGDKLKKVEDAVSRFRKELGEKVSKKVKKLADEVEKLEND
jgi:uncharacterized protein